MATYDMSPLDASERIPIKIHITNTKSSIDELKMISIATDCNISELKFEIEKALSIQQQHQQSLSIESTESDTDDIIQLTDEELKLSEYNISQNTIIELQLTDDCDWNESHIIIDMAQSPKSPQSQSSPTSKTPPNANNANNKHDIKSIPAQSRTTATDETIHFLTKHSKIQCRILLIVFVKFFF